MRLRERHKQASPFDKYFDGSRAWAEIVAMGNATAQRPVHAEKLRGYGVRVDFLLALTFALELWDWKTWEVVRMQMLLQP